MVSYSSYSALPGLFVWPSLPWLVRIVESLSPGINFQGLFTTALEEGEIITSVRFPVPQAASYQKFEQPASRFALVGVFVARFADGVRVAVTGASEDGVFRWSEAEAALSKEFRPDALMDLAINPMNMIADLHGSKEYRAHIAKVMTGRAVAAAG